VKYTFPKETPEFETGTCAEIKESTQVSRICDSQRTYSHLEGRKDIEILWEIQTQERTEEILRKSIGTPNYIGGILLLGLSRKEVGGSRTKSCEVTEIGELKKEGNPIRVPA